MNPNETFDARQYSPNQGTPKHPVGKFAARASNTELKPFKGQNAEGSNLEVEFTTDQGRITKRYGIYSSNTEQQRIAREQLSALCHATGVFNLTLGQSAFELRNSQCVIEVAPQNGSDKFNDVIYVYDMRGELPKAGTAPVANRPAPFNPTQAQPAFGAPIQAPAPFANGGQTSQPVNPAMGQFGGSAPMNPNAATGLPSNGPASAQFQPQPMTAPGQTAPFQPNGAAPPPAQPQWNQGQAPQQPGWANPQR